MKLIHFFGILLSTSTLQAQTLNQATANPPALPAPTPYAIVAQDANSQIWQSQTYEQAPDGSIVTNVHKYTELATGLNHLVSGQWVASSEKIEISPDGSSASATNGQHQLIFPGNIYSGTIKLVTPDGQTLESQPIGLSYADGSNSVLLAVVTNSTGAILPSGNQVIYTNAFAGLNADLLYTYTKAGAEQDVVLRTQPPDPASLGLNSAKTRLQVLTEFFNPPQTSVTATTVPTAAGNLEDDSLSFGAMQMGQGNAFLIGGNTPSVEVSKRWLTLNGRQFLIEEVPIVSIADEIDTLPPFVAKIGSGAKPVVSKNLVLPPRRLVKNAPKASFIAKAAAPTQGLVLDYVTVNSTITNFTFQGDTTYYISGTVDLNGAGSTDTFEGGTVIKYARGSGMWLFMNQITINCQASAYRPVILTAADDNSVGEAITNSTGNPTNYYAVIALLLSGGGSANTLQHLRIAYANTGIQTSYTPIIIKDSQFVNVSNAVRQTGSSMSLENVLMYNVSGMALWPAGTAPNCIAQNLTVHNANTFCGTTYGSLLLTNSLLVACTNLGSNFSGAYNYTNSSDSGIFQTVGAGANYLATNCPAGILGAGTTNIDPVLLADLQQKTTYPPLLLTNQTVAVNTILNPQAQRDTGMPSLGYHYDPIDFIVDNYAITNAVLTVTNGAAIASYNETGIQLQNGSSIVSIGSPLYPNWFVRYSSVQEEPILLGGTNVSSGITVSAIDNGLAWPNGQYRFSKFACPARGGYFFNTQSSTSTYSNLLVRDCELYSGYSEFGGNTNSVTTLQNNLFDRSAFGAYAIVPIFLAISNNLFFGASVFFWNQGTGASNDWQVFNNAFDTCGIDNSEGMYGLTFGQVPNGYNAYLNCSNTFNSSYIAELSPTNASDIVTNASLVYQTGPFGTFYQPTTSPLINMGSTNANLVGLYHYTVTTNEVVEGTNVVSIGYHYVAVDQYGNPLDYNGDGIPDYIEDANGNGTVDSGEIGWNITGDLGLNVIITRPRNGSILP